MLEVDRKFDFQHFIYDYINIYGSLQFSQTTLEINIVTSQAGSWGYYGRI